MDRKKMLMIGGGVALIAIILYMRSRSASSASTTTGATAGADPNAVAANDYANLAGDIQQAAANETNDMQTLNGQLAAQQAQETGDVSGLTGSIAGVAASVAALATPAPSAGVSAPPAPLPATVTAPPVVTTPAGQPGPSPGRGNGNRNRDRNRARPASIGTEHNSHHGGNHHPTGTAGHAVAPSSHAPKTYNKGGLVGPQVAQSAPPKPAKPLAASKSGGSKGKPAATQPKPPAKTSGSRK